MVNRRRYKRKTVYFFEINILLIYNPNSYKISYLFCISFMILFKFFSINGYYVH